MPLSPEQEWTLLACALVAHADGVVDDKEWQRVLWMLGERLDDDDDARWRARLGDPERLRARLAELPPPMPFFSESILEKAWRMALADGAGGPAEIAVHDDLAQRLGVPAAQVEQHRAHWLQQAQRRSVLVAGFAEIVAHLDGRLDEQEAQALDALIDRLPMTDEQRATARAGKDEPPTIEAVVHSLLDMDAEERKIALLALVPLVRVSADDGRERALFVEVAQRLAISADEAESMLA